MNRIEGNVLDNRAEMNRIEGNVLDNRAEIVQEVIDRTTSVGNEEAARIAADSVLDAEIQSIDANLDTKLNNNTIVGRIKSTGSIGPALTYTVPSGTYYGKCLANCVLEVQDSTTAWNTILTAGQSCLIVSDGASVRFLTVGGQVTGTWLLIKIS